LLRRLGFLKKKKIELLHTIDLHSHLLPSIDDGVNSIEESIDIIKRLQKLGFKKIITTPHIMSHRFPNTKETIYEKYNIIKKLINEQKIDIELEVSAEYYYDEHFLELIEKNEILTFGDNYLLLEFSYHNKPFAVEQTIHKLINLGYKPILAHPERYKFYKTKEDYQKLKDMGLFFQINMISTKGFYGKRVKKQVEIIIDNSMVDFIGSDIHNLKYFDSFSNSLYNKTYNKIIKKNNIKNNFL